MEYKPELAEGLTKIAEVWDQEGEAREVLLKELWDGLEKIPIDNAVAEPAAEQGRVAVVPATFGACIYFALCQSFADAICFHRLGRRR